MSAIYKTCKSIAPKILLICLAAHLGCFFGRQAFFLAFNSLRDVAATYVSEWPALLRELFNPRSTHKVGNRVRVYILELRENGRVAQIIVSQAHPELVRELFELYVPEIQDGIVEIESIARLAGHRTKIAVRSNDADVNPVRACIGQRSKRINSIIAELRNEKIDVIWYSADPTEYISNALSPAHVTSVVIYDDPKERGGKRAEVTVPDDQLLLAKGPAMQNVQLASMLTNWKIIVKAES
jgi:transcription termination/antitermination protein NusA